MRMDFLSIFLEDFRGPRKTFFCLKIMRSKSAGNHQGSRLTFQLASPVASDRFDSLAKTDFSLARYSVIGL